MSLTLSILAGKLFITQQKTLHVYMYMYIVGNAIGLSLGPELVIYSIHKIDLWGIQRSVVTKICVVYTTMPSWKLSDHDQH